MKFLFHTVVEYGGIPVFYNIFKEEDGYFAQLLDNPKNVPGASDFNLTRKEDKWVFSTKISLTAQQALIYEIENYRPATHCEKGSGIERSDLPGKLAVEKNCYNVMDDIKKSCVFVMQIREPSETLRKLGGFFQEREIAIDNLQMHRYKEGDGSVIIHCKIEKDRMSRTVQLLEKVKGVVKIETLR